MQLPSQWVIDIVKCCHSDSNSVSMHLPRYLSKGPLKHDFLDIYLTIFFRVDISRNTSAKTVISFSQMFQNLR